MSYRCEILADSIGPHSHRLTTFEVCFPRMVLADITRHRILSFSVESTRAIPTEQRIEMVRNDPYVPDFRLRAKGMGGGAEPSPDQLAMAQAYWRLSARQAANAAEDLIDFGKEHVGRLLEPFSWVSAIISGTEWDNLFALRCPPFGEDPHPDFPAQIELQIIANMMRTSLLASVPNELEWGDWHLPLWDTSADVGQAWMDAPDPLFPAKVSAGRCASISFLKHRANGSVNEAYARWEHRLAPAAHWSPGEHPAQCTPWRAGGDFGNFQGWRQLRKFYPNEANYALETI